MLSSSAPSGFWAATHPAYDVRDRKYHCLCGVTFAHADDLIGHCADSHRASDEVAMEVLSRRQFDAYLQLRRAS